MPVEIRSPEVGPARAAEAHRVCGSWLQVPSGFSKSQVQGLPSLHSGTQNSRPACAAGTEPRQANARASGMDA
jgi:hypothetical protein